MKLKTLVLLVPLFLLSFAVAQAGETPPLVAAEPGCGDAMAAWSPEDMLPLFTPAALPEEPILKAGCFGSYGSCQCYKIAGQSGCLTSDSGPDCSRCCANLHC